MAIFFHEKRGYKKKQKKTLYGFPSDGIVWSWHVPKLDAGMDTADGRLPPMISAESWSEEFFGSPPAAGSRWTLGLCETSRSDRCKLYGDSGLWSGGQQTLQTHPFKDLVNVTVLRRFDSGMIFFWHVPECSPFLENRTDKEVVTQYILVLNIFNIVCLLNLFSFVWEFICLLNNLNNIRNWILGFFLEDPGGHFCMVFFSHQETRQIYAQHLLRIDREIQSILQMLC